MVREITSPGPCEGQELYSVHSITGPCSGRRADWWSRASVLWVGVIGTMWAPHLPPPFAGIREETERSWPQYHFQLDGPGAKVHRRWGGWEPAGTERWQEWRSISPALSWSRGSVTSMISCDQTVAVSFHQKNISRLFSLSSEIWYSVK